MNIEQLSGKPEEELIELESGVFRNLHAFGLYYSKKQHSLILGHLGIWYRIKVYSGLYAHKNDLMTDIFGDIYQIEYDYNGKDNTF